MLSRCPVALEPGIKRVRWDGRSVGDWAGVMDGADAAINLAGRTVNCRYTDEQAIACAWFPPRVWLQASTATIYEHTHGCANGEDGVIGGAEEGVPASWAVSVEIAQRWEAAQQQVDTPRRRKVALRSALVMSPDRGGVLEALLWMARLGVGGPVAGGRQYVSWIHEHDFVRAIELLPTRDDIDGPVNLASPFPLPQRDLMKALRNHRIGLPATKLMAEGGPSSCARTPSSSSRAGAWHLPACSRRGSSSTTRPGQRRRRISFVATRPSPAHGVAVHVSEASFTDDPRDRELALRGMHAAVVGVDP